MACDAKTTPPSEQQKLESIFANRRHVALRATLPRLVHDIINPIFMLRTKLSVMEADLSEDRKKTEGYGEALQRIERDVADMNGIVDRAVQEVKVMDAIFKQEVERQQPKGTPILSVLMATVKSIDSTRTLIRVDPKSRRRAVGRVGELELTFASMILHVYEWSQPTEAAPLLVTANDHDAETLTRIVIASSDDNPSRPLNHVQVAESAAQVESWGGHVDLRMANGLAFTLPYVDM